MASLKNYRGLDVLDGGTPLPGGEAISENFVRLADWRPKCVWDKTAEPTKDDDSGDEFYPGSFWFYVEDDVPHLMICTDNTLGQAVWCEIDLVCTS